MSEKKSTFPNRENYVNKKMTRRNFSKVAGGIYLHTGVIAGKKNVFTTPEYLDMMVGAIKYAETTRDIKNIGFVVMPNFFQWIFQLSPKQDDPMLIYGEVKKFMAREILNNLFIEKKTGTFGDAETTKLTNGRIRRSKPEKILWTFEEIAKKMEKGNKQRYRVWQPKTETVLLSPEELPIYLQKMKKIPTNPRWQLHDRHGRYPYMYICEDYDLPPDDQDISYVETAVLTREVVASGAIG